MATHLDGGRDVVLPQYFAKIDEIIEFEELARRPSTEAFVDECLRSERRQARTNVRYGVDIDADVVAIASTALEVAGYRRVH